MYSFPCINGAFLSHRATPSYHPFLDGIFNEINDPASSNLPPFVLWLLPASVKSHQHSSTLFVFFLWFANWKIIIFLHRATMFKNSDL